MVIPPMEVPPSEATNDAVPVPIGSDPALDLDPDEAPDTEEATDEQPEAYVDDVEGGARLAPDADPARVEDARREEAAETAAPVEETGWRP